MKAAAKDGRKKLDAVAEDVVRRALEEDGAVALGFHEYIRDTVDGKPGSKEAGVGNTFNAPVQIVMPGKHTSLEDEQKALTDGE